MDKLFDRQLTVEDVVSMYFDLSQISAPIENFVEGDHPYSKYAESEIRIPNKHDWTDISDANLSTPDFFSEVTLNISTNSGSVYDMSILEVGTNDSLKAVGRYCSSNDRGNNVIVGMMSVPKIGQPITFSEFAYSSNIDMSVLLKEAVYIGPELHKEYIREQVEVAKRNLETWNRLVKEGGIIKVSPRNSQTLRPHESTAIESIKISLPRIDKNKFLESSRNNLVESGLHTREEIEEYLKGNALKIYNVFEEILDDTIFSAQERIAVTKILNDLLKETSFLGRKEKNDVFDSLKAMIIDMNKSRLTEKDMGCAFGEYFLELLSENNLV